MTTAVPRDILAFISTALLVFLGLKMIREGCSMSPRKAEKEYEEAKEDIEKHETRSSGQSSRGFGKEFFERLLSPAFTQSFALTLLCEWGDRSQISTVLMAAHGEVSAVLLGGMLGHALCLALAVIGGRWLSRAVPVRAMTICGGVVFLCFALRSLLGSDTD